MKCNPETSYPALYAYIGWLLAKKRENCAFLWLKFDPFPKNVLHQGCENALKVFLECSILGQRTISAPEIVYNVTKLQKLALQS